MTDTTTIRVSREAHQRLAELSASTGKPLGSVLEDAIEALLALQFAREATQQLDALRRDPEAWADYLAETDLPAGHDLDW